MQEIPVRNYIVEKGYYMDGDLNDKPTAMRSRSMARSQS